MLLLMQQQAKLSNAHNVGKQWSTMVRKSVGYKSKGEKRCISVVNKSAVVTVGQRFFPLDRRLGLLGGGYTPQVQEAVTRLGSRMTYGEAQEELQLMWGIDVSKATVCNITMRHGHAAYANAQARLEHCTQPKQRQRRSQTN